MSSLELSHEQQEILKKFRGNLSDLLQPRHDDRFLLRWLRARDYDLQKAEHMLRADFKFRKKIGADTVCEDYVMRKELQPYRCDRYIGLDNGGHTVLYFMGGICDFQGFCRSMTSTESMTHFVQIFEKCGKLLLENYNKTGIYVDKGTVIIDLTGFRLHQWMDKMVIRYTIQIIKLYTDHYPETLHVVYILNAPNMFTYVFNNIFRPLLNDVIIRKIKIYAIGDDSYKKDLFDLVPPELVPAYIGGELHDSNGDPKCEALINWKPLLPTCFYLTDQKSLRASDPGVKQKMVRERSYFEVERDVETPGSLLRWEFQTKDHNIKFGLFFREKRGDSNYNRNSNLKREQLVPIEIADCDFVMEKGDYLCKNPGTYILHFDNTYSWMRSKHLFYKIEVRPPSPPPDTAAEH